MADYYNRGGRQPYGNGRQQNNSGYNRSSGRQSYGDRSYPAFEEGYTAVDNRSRQSYDYDRSAQSRQSYDGRFIDAGDRYMHGFENEYIPAQQSSRYQQPQNSDRYSDSRGYSGGFEDDFDEPQQNGRYQQSNERYAENTAYSRSYPQQARSAGYPEYQREEYNARTSEQDVRRAGGRDYYPQGDYDMQRARGQENARQRYDGYDERYAQDDLAEDNRADGESYQRPRRQENYYRAPAGAASSRTASRTGKDLIGGVMNWFNGLTSQQMTWLLVAAAGVLVVVILIVCIALSADSCGGCSGGNDIPVVEQGDGEEAFNSGADFIYDDSQTEIVSTGDAMVTIDENLETDSFVVEVTDADGTYSRTDVHRAEAAELIISEQNETGFAFSLEVKAEGVSGTLSGHAYFCAEREAIYEGAQGLLNFNFGSNGITVYQIDVIEAFAGMTPDGTYVAGTPSYVEDAAEQSEQLGLDADIRKSDAVQSALDGMLSDNDAALLSFIFENGTERVYEGAEKGYDRNGTAINIDAELNAVKYYAYIDGTGEELVLICTADAKVYVGICDGVQYRYYTNDPNYAASAPKSIAGQAKGRNMELTFQQ